MNNLIDLSFNSNEESMKAGPKIYFRGVNRIHVNRFKAYTHILSNRLKYNWQVTESISEANAVATYQEQNNDKSVICLALYDSAPNLNPPAIDQMKLSFDEQSLIKQLNQAGRKLSLVKNNKSSDMPAKIQKIRVSGLPADSSRNLCKKLNSVNPNDMIHFKFVEDTINDESIIFIDQLIFVVEPNDPASVQAFYELEKLRRQDDLTIDQLTILVINNQQDVHSEQLFDEIYDQCDESTQVTLLNISNQDDLLSFISFFQ